MNYTRKHPSSYNYLCVVRTIHSTDTTHVKVICTDVSIVVHVRYGGTFVRHTAWTEPFAIVTTYHTQETSKHTSKKQVKAFVTNSNILCISENIQKTCDRTVCCCLYFTTVLSRQCQRFQFPSAHVSKKKQQHMFAASKLFWR